MAGLIIGVDVKLHDIPAADRRFALAVPGMQSRSALSAAHRSVALMQLRARTAPAANPRGIGQGGAVNTGNYLRRWRATRLPDGNAAVYNSAVYAGVIEIGRRAGSRWPPITEIYNWLVRKFGIGGRTKDAKALRASLTHSDDGGVSLGLGYAMVVARAIAMRGLKGRYVMTSPTAQRKMEEFFIEEFARELDKQMKRLGGSAT
jgi:hypothetical protein